MKTNNSRYNLKLFQAQPEIFGAKVLPEMQETLGELIKRRMKDVGIKNNSELARLIKRSDAYVGDLINDTAKTKSGIYKPRQDTLAALAKTLAVDEAEILSAIGYLSSKNVFAKPSNPSEFFDILDKLGLDIQFAGGRKVLEGLDEDDLQELLDGVIANATAKGKRKQKARV